MKTRALSLPSYSGGCDKLFISLPSLCSFLYGGWRKMFAMKQILCSSSNVILFTCPHHQCGGGEETINCGSGCSPPLIVVCNNDFISCCVQLHHCQC